MGPAQERSQQGRGSNSEAGAGVGTTSGSGKGRKGWVRVNPASLWRLSLTCGHLPFYGTDDFFLS